MRSAILLLVVFLSSCKVVKVYPEIHGPVYLSNTFLNTYSEEDKTLDVVSFNIKKNEQIELAIAELQAAELFSNADLLLLQEMDESGVQQIAAAFGLNYLYYPCTVQKKGILNFGNAILSKAAIEQPRKIVHPHERRDKQIRCATSCMIEIAGKIILVYSVHLETIEIARHKRRDQMDALVADIVTSKENADAVIVGGDFNTLFNRDRKALIQKFDAAGLDWQSAGLGATGSYLSNLIRPVNDHFFTAGLRGIKQAKLSEIKSSDHFPIMIRVGFSN